MKKTQTIAGLIDYINSDRKDLNIIRNVCSTNTNLKIYLCLDDQELASRMKKFRRIKDPSELLDAMIKKQPSINISVEVYDRVVESVRQDMEQYVKYNAYRMINAMGTQEDWISHFLVKFYYFSNFYRDRWFFPEKLTKKTKVKKTFKKYSDFLNLARKAITEERKVQARKAAENPEASLGKASMDSPIHNNNERMTLLDVTSSETQLAEFESQQDAKAYVRKILEYSDKFEDGKYTEKLQSIIESGEFRGKKFELVLLKIFAYKAGIITTKSLKFINSLSKTYKDKFGISNALLNKQMRELGMKK